MSDDVKRPPAKTFEGLVVWQKSHAFVPRIDELTAQLRRAAVPVSANIAEGLRQRGRADKARLLNVALGSLEEARHYLILARTSGASRTRESAINSKR